VKLIVPHVCCVVPLVLTAMFSPPAAEKMDFGTQAVNPRTVQIGTADGGVIHADVYGEGKRGIVLAHGGQFNKGSWQTQARQLAPAGFLVLAVDHRGYGESRGPGQEDIYTAPLHLDVLAGVRYLRSVGADRVFAIGASLGSWAVATAAIVEPGSISRLVLLSATPRDPPEKLVVPKLYIMARDDANSGGLRLPALRAHFDRAPEPKELIVVDGSAHAQFLFKTEHAARIMREIRRFLSQPESQSHGSGGD
jgi:pimeloyl-ACP methyl ester carboxylesterase